MKKKIIISCALFLLIGLGSGYVASRYHYHNKQTTPEPSKCRTWNVSELYIDDVFQDEKIRKIIIEDFGVHPNNIQGLEMTFSDNIDKSDPEAIVDPWGLFIDGYSRDCVVQQAPKIILEEGIPEHRLKSVIAHEFIHHYYSRPWFKDITVSEQELILFYQSNAALRERLKPYISDGILRLTEILAFSCTEFNPRLLPESINSGCDRALPNRKSVLSFTYN